MLVYSSVGGALAAIMIRLHMIRLHTRVCSKLRCAVNACVLEGLFLLSGIVFVVGVVEVGDLRLLLPATSHSNVQKCPPVEYFHLPSVCVCLSLSAKSSFTFHLRALPLTPGVDCLV